MGHYNTLILWFNILEIDIQYTFVQEWMTNGWMLGVYDPFNIISDIEQGCQWRKMTDMDETPLRYRPRGHLNLGPLVHKSSVLTTEPCTGCPKL